MAGPVEQTGVIIACPRCGNEVLQKSMIPLGVVDSVIQYLCVPCARTLVTTGDVQSTAAGSDEHSAMKEHSGMKEAVAG